MRHLLKEVFGLPCEFIWFYGPFLENWNNVVIYAGMGGYLKNKNNDLLFIFSSPVKASSVLMAEILAVKHLLKALVTSRWLKEEFICYLDSKEALSLIRTVKIDLGGDNPLVYSELRNLIKNPNFHFKHISRNFNLYADDLVKQGLSRSKLLQCWF